MTKNIHQNRLGLEPVVPLLVKLAIPAILSMFIQALYNVVDSIFVARISKEALAALSLAFPIQMVLISMAVGTGTGASSLISRLLGKGKVRRASSTAEHVLLISIVYGVFVGILGYFLSRPIISIFTNDMVLIDYGARYIRIILLGSTALFIPMLANNILRGEGNTFIPMITMLIGSILNIILDPLLIFGYGVIPQLGIEGAAIATVLSRIISGSFILIILFKGSHHIKLNFKEFKYDPFIIKGIFEVGFPAMTMQLLASIMMGGLNVILSAYSTTAIAVMGIFFRLQSFIFMPVFGLSQGYLPILGYNYGNGNAERMKESMKYTFVLSFIFTTVGFVIFQLFPHKLILLFSNDPELLAMGKDALRKISLAFPVIGPSMVGATTFQGIGKGTPSLILSLCRQIILLFPFAALMIQIGGVGMVWFSIPMAELISAVLMVYWLKSTMPKVFLCLERNV